MSIALVAASAFMSPLQHFLRWISPSVRIRATTVQAHQSYASASRRDLVASAGQGHTRRASSVTKPSMQSRPLRVVRILETGQASAATGRMVMSGRLADVCAELDRLAAREATRH